MAEQDGCESGDATAGAKGGARLPTRREKVLYVLLSPFILAWTSWNFWRLAMTGRMYVRANTEIVDASGGLSFWVTLGLYLVLAFASLVVLATFFGWLLQRRTPAP